MTHSFDRMGVLHAIVLNKKGGLRKVYYEIAPRYYRAKHTPYGSPEKEKETHYNWSPFHNYQPVIICSSYDIFCPNLNMEINAPTPSDQAAQKVFM